MLAAMAFGLLHLFVSAEPESMRVCDKLMFLKKSGSPIGIIRILRRAK
jgi:hypothetical protein